MFYGKSSTQSVNLNTNFFNSFSDTAALIVGAWNNQLSIKLKPAIGKDANGVRQYADDRTQIMSTSITIENAMTLFHGFEENVLPALRGEKQSGSASIVTGNADSRKILTLGYDGTNAYLSVATNLNNVGKAEYEIRHTFNKRGYLVDYVASEGNAVEHSYEAELFSFVAKLKEIQNLVPMAAHAQKYQEMVRNAFTNNNVSSMIPQTQPKQPQPSYNAPTSSMNDIDELPF